MATGTLNADGLYVKYGANEADPAKGGEYRTDGPIRLLEFVLDWEDLPAFGSTEEWIADDGITIPANAYIEYVEVVTIEDWDSAADAVTFTIGTIDTDRTTEHDFNGFIDAATQTEMNTGGSNVAGWVGALVGTQMTNTTPLHIYADQATADATVGRSLIRIGYSIPPKDTDTLGDVL